MLRHGVSEENLEPVLGTAALSSEFPKAKRAVALVVKLVAELERCDGELDEKFDELERKVSLRINQLTRDVQTLQAMVGKEPVSRRDTWRQ